MARTQTAAAGREPEPGTVVNEVVAVLLAEMAHLIIRATIALILFGAPALAIYWAAR